MALVDFNRIYNDYYQRSFIFAKSYVFDDMVAEDIASESLVALWQAMKKEEVYHPLSLLLTILKNKSINYLKHRERQLEMADSVSVIMKRDLKYRINCLEACEPDEIYSLEITEIVKQALDTLPAQTRKIFEMSRYEQKSINEIAEVMGLTSKAVEYHITKSLKVLRVALKDYLPLFYLLFE